MWLWEHYITLPHPFFILWNTGLIWKGHVIICEHIHFLSRDLLRKVMASVRLSTIYSSQQSPPVLTWKSHTDLIQESLESLILSPGTGQCLGALVPVSYHKATNNHLEPTTHPAHIPQPSLWRERHRRWRKTNTCCSLSIYLPDNALGNFEQICSLDTINKLYKKRDNKWFSWDFIITGFDPKAHAL